MDKKKSKLVEIKTKPSLASVKNHLDKIEDDQRREDSFVLLEMMEKATGEVPAIWGSAIIGFGNKRYVSPATGREVDWFRLGFAPRKANFSLYLGISLTQYAGLLSKLGKYKTGKGCVYINKLADIDLEILAKLVSTSAKKK